MTRISNLTQRGVFTEGRWRKRTTAFAGRHVKSGHVKDTAQDGNAKVLILSIAIFQRRRTGSRGASSSTPGACMCGHRCATTTAHWTPLPHHHHHHHHHRRRLRRRQSVKDAARGVLEDVLEGAAEGVAQDLAFGARAAQALLGTPPPPPPPPPSLCSSH